MTEPRRPRRTSIGSQRNPESEEAILSAAAAILREGGLGAFSIEAVARRAKAGKPTIYRWWPSKAALLLDVYHRQKEVSPPVYTGNVRGDLMRFMTELLSYWKRGGGAVFRSVIAEAQGDPAAAAALAGYAAERRIHTGAMIREAQAAGQVRSDADPELIGEMLSSFAWSRLLTDRLDMSEPEIAAYVDSLVDGIRPR